MKTFINIFLFIVFIFIASCASTEKSQTHPDSGESLNSPLKHVANETPPQITRAELKRFRENLGKYISDLNCDYKGRAHVIMTVNKEGKVENPHPEEFMSLNCQEAVERAAKRIKFDEPGMTNGKPVSVKMTIPFFVRF